MTERFPRIGHRLAAVGLLLAVIMAATVLFILPLTGYIAGLRADILAERELLGRFESFASDKDKAQSLAEATEAAMRSGIFLPGETDALRTASLQGMVTEIAGRSGVRLASTRGLPSQEEDGLTLIGVQSEFEADMRKLQAILAAIEARRPILFVHSAQISPLASRRRDSDELRVRLAIFAAVGATKEAKAEEAP